MTPRTRSALVAVALLTALCVARVARAAELRIVIAQAQAGDARRYQPLLAYLAKQGLPAAFVTAPDNRAAADMFAAGRADAMFSGSGIACTLFIKGLAEPLVRPVGLDGVSTYSAVVVAPKGSARFAGTARYFDGKRVIFASLASAGEFFFRSLGPSKPAAILKAASHGAAIDAVSRGQADVAIVKNHVWTKEQAKYAGLESVGGDAGENPDASLLVSKRLDAGTAQRLSATLVALQGDASAEALAAKEALSIRAFIPATKKDFAHTLELVEKAGVTKDFGYSF
ncbi:MAG TPA: PhnD/SsuA/transferrin family substrate-binding protein [Anaeromyxobacter sp.]